MKPSRLLWPTLLLLVGCATLSQDECMTGNWQSIGYTDGVKGQAADRIGEHNKACSSYGVAVDLDRWMRGYNQGLDVYCTADNGAWVGASGSRYNNVCTGPRGADFQHGYEAGLEVYQVKLALTDTQQAYSNSEQRLDQLQDDMDYEEKLVKDNSTPSAERDAAVDRLRALERKYGYLEQEMYQINESLGGLQQDVNLMYQQLRDQFPGMRAF